MIRSNDLEHKGMLQGILFNHMQECKLEKICICGQISEVVDGIACLREDLEDSKTIKD
jgi:hypothetical protein